jgi:hypothetical protein
MILQRRRLRVVHQRQLERLRAENDKLLLALRDEVAQLTQRLHRVQQEQQAALARSHQSVGTAVKEPPRQPSVREALERELDAVPESRHREKSDGFADTEILPHEDKSSGLLLR